MVPSQIPDIKVVMKRRSTTHLPALTEPQPAVPISKPNRSPRGAYKKPAIPPFQSPLLSSLSFSSSITAFEFNPSFLYSFISGFLLWRLTPSSSTDGLRYPPSNSGFLYRQTPPASGSPILLQVGQRHPASTPSSSTGGLRQSFCQDRFGRS